MCSDLRMREIPQKLSIIRAACDAAKCQDNFEFKVESTKAAFFNRYFIL